MELLKLGKIISFEKTSFEYIISQFPQKLKCQSCLSSNFYFLSSKRIKRTTCRKAIYPLKNTFFSKLRILLTKWLSLIKLFELSVSAKKHLRNQILIIKQH